MSEDAGAPGKRSRSDTPEEGPEPGPAAGAFGDEEDDDFGPMPMPNTGDNNGPRKKRKGERVYID